MNSSHFGATRRISSLFTAAYVLAQFCGGCEVESDVAEDGYADESVPMELRGSETFSYHPVAPLQRIYSLYNASVTDQLLTQHKDEADWLPTTNSGWSSESGVVLFLEEKPQVTTAPLYRLYKGAPQREHFYTTDKSEGDAAVAQGWQYEGPAGIENKIVGHIYKTQLPGTVPLYRLVRWNNNTSDLVHRYTISNAVKSSLEAQGYTYEKITGYLYTSAFPKVAGGHVFGTRTGCDGVDFRDCSFGLFHSVASIGAKPAGKTKQVMRFKLWTPDLFEISTLPPPQVESRDHIFFIPRGFTQINPENLQTAKLHGIGLVLDGGTGNCGVGQQKPFLEEVWHVPQHTGCNFSLLESPDNGPGDNCGAVKNTCGASELQNNRWYDVAITVSDSGNASYTIYEGGVLRAANSVAYGSAPKVNEYPFNSATTGYFMTNVPPPDEQTRDHTTYVTNLSVTWE